ncbi:unnamed protein product [Arabidopsis halleri]
MDQRSVSWKNIEEDAGYASGALYDENWIYERRSYCHI